MTPRLLLAGAVAALLLRALTARAGVAPCDASATPVRGTAPTRVPIELSNNHVLVTVCVGGRELTFLLDTGAGGNVIDMPTARELGVEFGAPMQTGGAGAGVVQGAFVKRGSVRVPGVAGDFPLTTSFDMRRLRQSKGRPIHGILGLPFIERYVLAIDYSASELRLYERKSFKCAGAGSTIPIVLENGHPIATAEVHLAVVSAAVRRAPRTRLPSIATRVYAPAAAAVMASARISLKWSLTRLKPRKIHRCGTSILS